MTAELKMTPDDMRQLAKLVAGEVSSPKLAYNVREASKALGISHTQVHRLVRGGALPAIRLGSRVLIARDALAAYVASLPEYIPGDVQEEE